MARTVADLLVRFGADTKDAERGMDRVDKGIKDLSQESGRTKTSLGEMFNVAGGNLLSGGIRAATNATLDLGRAAIGVFVDAAQASANMNAQVSGIGAVLGLTADDLSQVKGLINELGVNPNLKVNAQEAADAIDMLARNGLTLPQIMGGAAEATVFLANATGGDFATSANVATDVMAMFGIKAKNMMTAVDGITSVTVASKFGLNDYALAIAQAGGVASSLGVEFEDFNTSIAATSSSFASGSDAGTSFKTFLQRLVPQSDVAMDAMAELGLYTFNAEKAMSTLSSAGIKPLGDNMGALIPQLMSVYAAQNDVDLSTEKGIKAFTEWTTSAGLVQNAFYDANGQLKNMADISTLLNQATADLSEEQKNQYLTTIFGSDAMRTAFGLADKGAVVYTDLEKASKELGVSQEDLAEYISGGITQFEALQATMRKTDALEGAQMRVDNLAGDMEIFSGIVDSLKLQIGDQLDPALRSMFQSATVALTAATPRILAFGQALGTRVAVAVERVTRAFKVLQSGGGARNIALALGISPGVIGTIQGMAKHIDTLKGAFAGLAAVLAGNAIVGAITGIGSALAVLISPMGLITGAAILLGAAWANNWGGIQEKTWAVWGTVQPALSSMRDWLQTNLPAAIEALQNAFAPAWDAVSSSVSTAWDMIQPILAQFRDWVLFSLPLGMAALGAVASLAWNAIKSTITTVWTNIEPVLSTFYDRLQTALPAAFDTLKSAAANAWSALKESVVTAWNTIQPIVSRLWNWAQFTLPLALASFGTVAALAWEAIKSATSTAWNIIEPVLSGMGEWVQTTLPAGFDTLKSAASTTWTSIQSVVETAWGIIQPPLSELWNWMQISAPLALFTVGAGFTLAWNTIKSAVTSAWDAIQPALSELKEKIGSILSPITSVIGKFVSWKDVMVTTGAIITGTILPAIGGFVGSVVAAVAPIALAFVGITVAVSLLRNAWENNWGGIQEKTAAVWGAIDPIFISIQDAFTTISGKVSTTLGPSFTRLGQSLNSAFSGLSELGPKFDGLRNAINGMITAVQPIITSLGLVIGSVFGFISILAINSFSAAIGALPSAIGIAIDQLTLMFNTIADTITSVVGIVVDLINGDFAGAWENAQALASTSVQFILGSLTNLSLMGGLLLSTLKTVITNTFKDLATAMGIDNITAQLDALKEKITNFFTGEGNIFSTAFSVVVAAPTWLADLTGWDWPDIPELISDWWPDIAELTSDWWPDIAELTPDWWPKLPKWEWPSIPMPGWVQSLIDLFGGGPVETNYSAGSSGGGPAEYSGSGTGAVGGGGVRGFGPVLNEAVGTNYFPGGLTWVDEKGAELFHFPDGQWAMGSDQGAHLINLPRGTQIYSHENAMKMLSGGLTPIGANADGTTRAPVGGGNVFAAITSAAASFSKTGDKISKATDKAAKSYEAAAKKMQQELEAALGKVPGLFGASPVTAEQMKWAELGIPQNFADDWLRRLTDEVVNGVNWDGVDIKDAALRAGLDPSLPAKAILELVTQKWNDQSFFANGNTDLINMEAVQKSLDEQAAQKAGRANILALFGIQPEQATTEAVALGGTLRTGIEQGLAGAAVGTGGTQIGSSLLAGITNGVTPEQLAPVGASVVDSLALEMGKPEYSDKIGAALSSMFTGFLANKESLTDVSSQIMGRIAESLGNVTGIDMVGRFSASLREQLALDASIKALHDIGERILNLVFEGYFNAAKDKEWPNATIQLPAVTNTPIGKTASGTDFWRGGLTWVGERGPEIVALPRGSRVYNNRESMAMAGAGGQTIINLTQHNTVANNIDLHELAYKVSEIIQRRIRH